MSALFFGFCVWYNRKKFTSVPVKVVDINLHFHEQLLMSQDKTSYHLRVEGKWTRNEILYYFPFNLNISNVKKKKTNTKNNLEWPKWDHSLITGER